MYYLTNGVRVAAKVIKINIRKLGRLQRIKTHAIATRIPREDRMWRRFEAY